MYPARENIYWLFSTLLQVIATFVGLLAAGFFFIHGKIDEQAQKDETLQEIYSEIKSQYYKRFKSLFIITAFSIIMGCIAIYLNVWDMGWWGRGFDIIVVLLNLLNLVLAGWFFIFMIDPDIINHTARRLVKRNAGIFNSGSGHSISQNEFNNKFAALDKILRIVGENLKIGVNGQGIIPFADLAKELRRKEIINEEQLQELNQISKTRNISSHSTVESIEAGIGTSADQLNKELSIINDREKV